jgi:hypothetical protein
MRHLYVVIQSGWVGQEAHQQEAVRLHLLVNVLVCLSKAFGPTSGWWRPRARASVRSLHPYVAFLHQRAMPCLPFLGALLAGIFGVFCVGFSGRFEQLFEKRSWPRVAPKAFGPTSAQSHPQPRRSLHPLNHSIAFTISELCPACLFWVRHLLAFLTFFLCFRAVSNNFSRNGLDHAWPQRPFGPPWRGSAPGLGAPSTP